MTGAGSAAIRPRRSILYMPGSNLRALEKAKTLAADGLILDLEDSVSPEAKITSRSQVCAALGDGGYGDRELIVRINGLDTEWGKDDLAAVVGAGPHAILVPKVESATDVRRAADLIQSCGGAGGTGGPALWCMMETPRAILHAEEIAAASNRIECLVMGTSDLTKDLHAVHTPRRLPMLTSLTLCLLAARAAGLTILDGVHLDLEDDEGFAAVCRQGLELGFDGKTLIHPRQLAPCNEIFAPQADEVAFARRVIDAFGQAEADGKALVVLEGKLIENLHVVNARRIVALADAIHHRAASP